MTWIGGRRGRGARRQVAEGPPPPRSGLSRALLLGSVAVLSACTAGGDGGQASPEPAVAVAYQPYAYLSLERPGSGPVTVADPSVIKADSTWYLYGTSSDEGFEMWSSTDLRTWDYGGLVWTPTPGSWNDEGDFWAPELLLDGSDVWMYYTANERIGVARADSPEGPFEDVLADPLLGAGFGGVGDGVYDGEGGILADNEEKAIDAFLLETSAGDLYLYASIFTPFSVIAVMPMDDPVTPAGPPQVLLDVKTGSWEGFVREGPYVIEHDGVFHLMYSAQGGNTACYAVGDATSTSPTGPFERRADNPILRQSPEDEFWGPGHHGLVDGADGDLLMFFHTKRDAGVGYDRGVRYAPISFDDGGALVLDPPQPGVGVPVQDECIFG